jgi:hypothetical protein
MYTPREIKLERLVEHAQLNIEATDLIFSVYRFEIFRLKIIHSIYAREYVEIDYVILDRNNPSEKCLVYIIMSEPGRIFKIKYWRAVILDKELANYVVQAFVNGYLAKKFSFEKSVSLK